MNNSYTAIMKQDGDWWIGWVEEVPGVNAQEKSKEALLASLKVILREALEFNRAEAREAAQTGYSEEPILI
jgi:predicted RNase H-like HicB family nuclease